MVQVASSSICGSDLHLISLGWVEGQILGHEFAGYTPDGTAVAVEPLLGCNHCDFCDEGRYALCLNGTSYLGIDQQGGMAEYVEVPEHLLCELPSGLPIESACLTEPMAVAVNAFAPQPTVRSTTQLDMGLFDFLQPKPSQPKPQGGGKPESDVFGGRGARITIREDEDNAMWVEEDDSGKRKGIRGN